MCWWSAEGMPDLSSQNQVVPETTLLVPPSFPIHAAPQSHTGREEIPERRLVVVRHGGTGLCAVAIGKRISMRPLEQLQLVHVARKCRLGHVNAAPSQLAAQLILAGHSIAGQHFADYIQALGFHGAVSLARKAKARSAGRKPRLNKYTTDMEKYARGLFITKVP